eukprot:3074825-Amphidinium_carterae.2
MHGCESCLEGNYSHCSQQIVTLQRYSRGPSLLQCVGEARPTQYILADQYRRELGAILQPSKPHEPNAASSSGCACGTRCKELKRFPQPSYTACAERLLACLVDLHSSCEFDTPPVR